MMRPIERVDMNQEELDALLERARTGPLSEEDCAKLKGVIETLSYLTDLLEDRKTTIQKLRQILFGASTEKTSNLVKTGTQQASETGTAEGGRTPSPGLGGEQGPKSGDKPKGHGRNGALSYIGATKIKISHESLKPGDGCPKCQKGKVYVSVAPRRLVRIVGQAPLGAKVYEMESLRCNLCLEVFTAQAPEGVGEKKYDETSGSMIALLKYGTGFPFYRLEHLQGSVGIPLPASTQWEIVHEVAGIVEPAHGELIRQAAQGEVLHNDDTTMKILALMKETNANREEADSGEARQRTGIFTSGIVSIGDGRKIALFFTGRKHAGENLSDVLAQRASGLGPPIQMCDALSRNVPEEFEVLLGNCTVHGRRKFVDVFANFPEECRYVLETLQEVYKNDAVAKGQGMTAPERLAFHQAQSGPVMEELEKWLKDQIAERKTEPNSGLGKAISYWKNHWKALTLFLRVPGAPLDNNVCERGLKKAILHRKNAMFFKTAKGAHVADIFMSLIHTCELSGVDPFDYLTQLQRHPEDVSLNPKEWMPWKYRETIERSRGDPSISG